MWGTCLRQQPRSVQSTSVNKKCCHVTVLGCLGYCSGCSTSDSCSLLAMSILFVEIWDWGLKVCTVLKRRLPTQERCIFSPWID